LFLAEKTIGRKHIAKSTALVKQREAEMQQEFMIRDGT
jgi:hypothetical protein